MKSRHPVNAGIAYRWQKVLDCGTKEVTNMRASFHPTRGPLRTVHRLLTLDCPYEEGGIRLRPREFGLERFYSVSAARAAAPNVQHREVAAGELGADPSGTVRFVYESASGRLRAYERTGQGMREVGANRDLSGIVVNISAEGE
jgi:hypothetical protein